ncbi:MAG: alpha/beta family hydrolase [Pseudomonadota bacterium]
MATAKTNSILIAVNADHTVSGLLRRTADSRACFVLAHGAGAGMQHAFMAAFSDALCELGIATLRYQFPYMVRGSRRPDSPKLATATVRAAAIEARRQCPELPLFAGGKSFGGRMTSLAQAEQPLEHVCGLIFVGFPLHPAGKPSTQRATHLESVDLPMLFLQGTRDKLAGLDLLQPTVDALGDGATLSIVDGADHSFHVLKRSGRTDDEVLRELATTASRWMIDPAHQ